MSETSNYVLFWWGLLSCIAVFNIGLLIYAYFQLKSKQKQADKTLLFTRKWQFILASIYTLGCGFRSILPRGDIRRIVMVDAWISSVVIGRSVATIAELSFVAQWCFILYEAAIYTQNKTIKRLVKVPFILILIAECSSWYACTTSNYMGTVIEESLWAIAASITVYGFLLARPYYEKKQRNFLTFASVAGVLYVCYMVAVDVPEYFVNWQAAEAAGKTYLSVWEGLKEIATTWTMTRAYEDWRYEFIWMTLYFSVAVWGSIFLVNSPFLNKKKAK